MQDGELLIFGLCGQSLFFRVAHMHRPEETLHAQSLCREPGGKGYNQAVAAARLGARVTFAAAVGRDADADDCAALLAREGVQARLFPKAGEHTACAVILTDAAGENRVTVYPGASRLLDAQDVLAMAGAFARASVVLLTPEIPEPAFAQAVALAREAGARLIVNPAPFVPWVVPYLREAWCVTPNRQEAGQLPGLDGGEPLERALRTAPYARMAVTLGAQGALCLASGAVFARPGSPCRSGGHHGRGRRLQRRALRGAAGGRALSAGRFARGAGGVAVRRAAPRRRLLPHPRSAGSVRPLCARQRKMTFFLSILAFWGHRW